MSKKSSHIIIFSCPTKDVTEVDMKTSVRNETGILRSAPRARKSVTALRGEELISGRSRGHGVRLALEDTPNVSASSDT